MTKQSLLRCGGARAILSCVHTEDPAVLLFACGALQNLCYERDWAELAVSYDVQLRLETLLTHEDAMIVRYASGALQNITRALQLNADGLSEFAMAAIKERSLEHRREEWVQQRAISKLTHAIKEIPADLRQQRHENGRRRRQRSLQMDRNDPLVASRTSSRPSSAASSRSTNACLREIVHDLWQQRSAQQRASGAWLAAPRAHWRPEARQRQRHRSIPHGPHLLSFRRSTNGGYNCIVITALVV